MDKKAIYKVESNKQIAKNVYNLRLLGPTGMFREPGQFVNIQLCGHYLRRPFSVAFWEEDALTVVYKVVGRGTAQMAGLEPGATLDVLAGLGHGFSAEAALGKRVVLAGGGCGAPPLYGLARELARAGAAPVVALGFASAEDVFYEEAFRLLGCEVHIATEDGSHGEKGYVTQVLAQLHYDHYCTCGPMPMLRAVHALGEEKGALGQLSFEERMGCGFGACMGCSCHTQFGAKRVCVDGPVFSSQEVVFA